MRVVLDTNVLARVVMSPSGAAAELFDRVRQSHILVVSPQITAELLRVLSYQRLRQVHQLDDSALNQFVEDIEAGSLLVQLPAAVPRVVPHDADDDRVVATAVAGAAQVLCTRNLKHLGHSDVVRYCRERSIEILDDLALLAQLRRLDEQSETP